MQEQLFENVLKEAPFVILIEGTNAGKACLCGIYCSQAIDEVVKENNSSEKVFYIPNSEDNLMFYYQDDFNMHFNVPKFQSQNFFGQFA